MLSIPDLLFRQSCYFIPQATILLSGRQFAVPKPRDWSKVIDRLNKSRAGELKVKMGSPGSAQVTRCRLLAQWNNLEAETVGATLVLRLPR
jgi:hypothetical protein